MSRGRGILGRRSVHVGVSEALTEVAVEGCFADGTKLVTLHHPIAFEATDFEAALYGSGLTYKPTVKQQPQQPLHEPYHRQAPATPPANPSESVVSASAADVAASASMIPASPLSPSPSDPSSALSAPAAPVLPGEMLFHPSLSMIAMNSGRRGMLLTLTNLDDRPIQVGSHYHLLELNPLMSFDRRLAYGMRLNIPAGTAVRFEPGVARTVRVVELAGRKVIKGGSNLAQVGDSGGRVDAEKYWPLIEQKLSALKFAHAPQVNPVPQLLASSDCIRSRSEYASMYGPTVGDRVRLGDTNLFVEVEWDAVAHYGALGDELKFGGGKVLRDGQGQQAGGDQKYALDLCISNVLIIDARGGVFKADVGIRKGRIVGIGKAGNPDTMCVSHPELVFGVHTDSIDASGMILTAGGMDTHVHFICPNLLPEALASGLTTLVGGGVGPTSGTNATTCTTSPRAIQAIMEATDNFPMNIGITGKGNASDPAGLAEQIEAGCIGMKLHEDWGSTPACIDTCLTVAEEHDVQVTIHTDTLNESGSCPHTIAAIGRRTIHAYHAEGAGGGHAPDIISCVGNEFILPSSTNPTRPFTSNTVDEHVDMLMVCHHLDKNLPEDVAFAESRIRGETIGAEDILHDIGAISMMSSDSQAMGRIGEVITRTWQTAHKMKAQRGHLAPDHTDTCSSGYPQQATGQASPAEQQQQEGDVPASASSSSSVSGVQWSTPHDNFRVRRYLAKYTCNPAIAHGVSHLVGGVRVGLLADLVLWTPAGFGTRPHMVIKGGIIAMAQMGDANASIPTPQPSFMRKMFAATGNSLLFVSPACAAKGVASSYAVHKRVESVRGCRGLTKRDMILNSNLPAVTVDPQTFRVTADGVHLTCEPATQLPLTNKLYGLF